MIGSLYQARWLTAWVTSQVRELRYGMPGLSKL